MPPKVDKWVIGHFFDMLHLNMNSLQRYLLRVGDKTTLGQLGKMQNASAIPALKYRLSDPDAGVRAGILQALGELHASAAIDTINASLNDNDPEIRFQALVALSKIDAQPSDDLITKIESLFEDGSIKVRMQALITLGKLGRG